MAIKIVIQQLGMLASLSSLVGFFGVLYLLTSYPTEKGFTHNQTQTLAVVKIATLGRVSGNTALSMKKVPTWPYKHKG